MAPRLRPEHLSKLRLGYALIARYYGLAFAYLALLVGGPILMALLTRNLLPVLFYGAFSFVPACVLVYSMLPRFTRYRPAGLRLDPAAHPRIHGAVREILDACGLRAPIEVFVDLRLNASAGRARVEGRSAAVVTIGLPLFALLTRAQLRAILAHEVGHVFHQDIPFARLTGMVTSSIERSIALLLRARSPLFRPFLRYQQECLRRIGPYAQRQELMADAFAARLVDRASAGAALERLTALAGVYDRYMGGGLATAAEAGKLSPLVRGFDPRHPAVAAAAADRLAHLARSADSSETHPALRERLDALETSPSGPPPAEDAPGTALLDGDLDAMEAALAAVLVGRPLARATPDELRRDHFEPAWRRLVARYQRLLEGVAAADVDEVTGSYRFVYALAELERDREVSEEWARSVLDRLVGCVLYFVLSERGWTLDLVPGVSLAMRRGDESVDPFGLLEQLRHGRLEPEAWKAQAEALGIADVDLGRYAVAPAAADLGGPDLQEDHLTVG